MTIFMTTHTPVAASKTHLLMIQLWFCFSPQCQESCSRKEPLNSPSQYQVHLVSSKYLII